MKKKICLITPGILASNPRLVKEAEALCEAGYAVHIIYTRHVRYLLQTDDEILQEHPGWTYDRLSWAGSSPDQKLIKWISGLKRRAACFLIEKGLYPGKQASFLLNRFYFWQLIRAYRCNAGLYIAHYPESLEIAARAARKNKTAFAYDAEDYYRGENFSAGILKAIQSAEDKWLKEARYITGASPLIARRYKELYPETECRSVDNVFPLKRQPPFRLSDSREPINFFWFSQTIGPGRGLESFMEIMSRISHPDIRLTLLGNVSHFYQQELMSLWAEHQLPPHQLIFVETLPEKSLFEFASRQDIGLCLEIPSVMNKDLCLSNKLFTYILAGNFLILSHTAAQEKFYHQYSHSGICISLHDPYRAAAEISELLHDTAELNRRRHANYLLGRDVLNFDRQKHTLIEQVEHALT